MTWKGWGQQLSPSRDLLPCPLQSLNLSRTQAQQASYQEDPGQGEMAGGTGLTPRFSQLQCEEDPITLVALVFSTQPHILVNINGGWARQEEEGRRWWSFYSMGLLIRDELSQVHHLLLPSLYPFTQALSWHAAAPGEHT